MHVLELIAKAYENSEDHPHLHPKNADQFKEWSKVLGARMNKWPQSTYVDFFTEHTKVRLYRPISLYK